MKLFSESFRRRRLFRSKGDTQKLFLFFINELFLNNFSRGLSRFFLGKAPKKNAAFFQRRHPEISNHHAAQRGMPFGGVQGQRP
ncbi:MAG: hypothetical protein ABF706_02160 [Novacetimonas hansenii]